MAFIGNQPAESFTSFATQEFSTSATTSYTLDHAVANENEIALFINNVRQQPGSGKAYTATGTTLTLSEATASTDTMYCVFLGRALQTVTPATNSITAAMVGNDLISGKDALTSEPASTDELLVSDAGTLKRFDFSLITNTPAWKMGMSGQQSLSYDTVTKINFDTSIIDTDSGVDTTNKRYTIPSGKGGKYIVYCYYRTGTGTDSASYDIFVYKNGSLLNDAEDMQSFTVSQSYNTVQCTGMLDLSAGDYLEMYARQADQNFTADIGYSNEARFWGYKLIGV